MLNTRTFPSGGGHGIRRGFNRMGWGSDPSTEERLVSVFRDTSVASPLQVGFELPPGKLKGDILRANEFQVSHEVRAWHSDGSAWWVWVDGPMFDKDEISIETGPGIDSSHLVVDQSNGISITDGAHIWTWQSGDLVPSGGELYLIDQNDRKAVGEGSIIIESANDHKVVLLVDAEYKVGAEVLGRCRVRWYVFAECPWVHVEHTWICTRRSSDIRPKEIGITVPGHSWELEDISREEDSLISGDNVKLWTGGELDYRPASLVSQGVIPADWVEHIENTPSGGPWTTEDFTSFDPSPIGTAKVHELRLSPGVLDLPGVLTFWYADPAHQCSVNKAMPLMEPKGTDPVEELIVEWRDELYASVTGWDMTGWYWNGYPPFARYEHGPDDEVRPQWWRLEKRNAYWQNKNLMMAWRRSGDREWAVRIRRLHRYLCSQSIIRHDDGTERFKGGVLYETHEQWALPWQGVGTKTWASDGDAVGGLVMDWLLHDSRFCKDVIGEWLDYVEDANKVGWGPSERAYRLWISTPLVCMSALFWASIAFPASIAGALAEETYTLCIDETSVTGLNEDHWTDWNIANGPLYKSQRKSMAILEWDRIHGTNTAKALGVLADEAWDGATPVSYQHYGAAIQGPIGNIARCQVQLDQAREVSAAIPGYGGLRGELRILDQAVSWGADVGASGMWDIAGYSVVCNVSATACLVALASALYYAE